MESKARRIEAVRRFNRFYTMQIGLLNEGLLSSPFSLTEARVIYELAQHESVSAVEVADALRIDAGYLSRILRSFAKRGLVEKRRSPEDRRRVLVSLSDEGRRAFHGLDVSSREQIAAMLGQMSPECQTEAVAAMRTVQRLLGHPPVRDGTVILRPHRPGDIGWVVQRHGELYHQSHGWDERFEAMVAEIVSRFVLEHDPDFERCWIAEKEGERVGSVFLVRRSATVGQLRMLLVEPSARGLGLGTRLVGECVSHARFVGYERMVLFTEASLEAARRIYEAEGFALKEETRESSWGRETRIQCWELDL